MQGLREDFRLYVAQGPCFEYSSIISSRQDIEWIISQLPEKPKTIALLFSSSTHGWKLIDLKDRCDGRSQIIALFKSTKGKTAGVYLDSKVTKTSYSGDSDSIFWFGLDQKIKNESDDGQDSFHNLQKEVGLCAECLIPQIEEHDKINTNYSCDCDRFSEEEKEEYFKVPVDELSNSILNEESNGKEERFFSIAALETWVVTYEGDHNT